MSELSAHVIRDLVAKPNPTILEIGCNDGTDTWTFLEAMPDAKITCFECDPRASARFYSNGPKDKVDFVQAAVCDVDGLVQFHASSGQPPVHRRNINHYTKLPEWDLSGSLYEPTGHLQYSPWVTFPPEKICMVSAIRLDTWKRSRQDIELVDFIWADVQGAEASLILGESETLKATRYFYTEYYDRPMYAGQVSLQVIHNLLPDFDLVKKYGDNILLKNRSIV